MGKSVRMSLLIVSLYCFPFVYFSMHQDFANRSMLGYLTMIVATSLLAFFSKALINSIPIIIGNIASGIVSFYLVSVMMGNEGWDSYFKPLTALQLLILVSILNLIPQFLSMRLANRYRNKIKE